MSIVRWLLSFLKELNDTIGISMLEMLHAC